MNKRIIKKRYKLNRNTNMHNKFAISSRDTWACDTTLAKFLRDLTIKFKLYNNGIPQGYTEESWNAKLESMAKICDKYVQTEALEGSVEFDDYYNLLKELPDLIIKMWW